ncbi:MAG: Glycogen synthase [Elusimicrobia bacterium]|nr:Glycogen synthase [Elusimicrobiota bacterium]
MKILFAASEGVPFSKTGGLADVVGALPGALAAKRHSVCLILPLYRETRERFPKIKFIGRTIYTQIDSRLWPVQIWRYDVRPNFRVFFADCPHFFDRPGVYGPHPGGNYDDNDVRFAFFSRAALDIARAVAFQPDIIHVHDWQTGLLPAYLYWIYKADPYFSKVRTVFTIHNMAYQGNFPTPVFHRLGLPREAYSPKGVEFYGKVSFMKAGLVFADALNTVSPSYAREISLDPKFGCGMEGILRERAIDFSGILNGLDVKFWDPKTDKNLKAHFDKDHLDNRALCKSDLQAVSHLPVTSAPLMAFIGRLDHQKGIDILIESIVPFLKEGAQFIGLGQGQYQYSKSLEELRHQFPSQIHVESKFSEPYAHKIYAGADIFLMPSRYEPCGLGQLIAMRYGAVPIVTPTGGLLDTVKNTFPDPHGTGFISEAITPEAFQQAIREALELFQNKKVWSSIQKRAMTQDFSWRVSIQDYLALYESLLS